MNLDDHPTEPAVPPAEHGKSSESYLHSVTKALASWLGFDTGSKRSYQGKTVLITGASSGIGAAFAEEFATRGANLVLTAHPNDTSELDDEAEKIRKRSAVNVETLVADLSNPGGAQVVIDHVRPETRPIDVLINNAGFATYGDFDQVPIESVIGQIQCNVLSAVRLTHAVLPSMRSRRDGEIVHTSSIGAFIPMPYCATYCATKAFLLHFSEALWAENRAYGVEILALCPGPTRTNITRNSNFRLKPLGRMEDVEDVVAAALSALADRRSQVHSTTVGAIRTFVASLLPRRMVLGAALYTMKRCAVNDDSKKVI